ncbi:MAG: helix-turn-helix transcriptional regulator [Planctomycetes bacterium]|nr:helix-turn-helix transcriptional regulator [Planctomycetota bacterium]
MGVYRFAQQCTWSNPYPVIGLHIRDLLWRQRTGSDVIERHLPPNLYISGAGIETTYEYGPERENWVIQIETNHIRNNDDPTVCEIFSADNWIVLPQRVYLNNSQCSFWQQHFQKLLEQSRDSSPRAELMVKSGICAILSGFIELGNQSKKQLPVEKFKQLIDEDSQFTKNLSQLSEDCGYSADHMRILFSEHFNLTPVQYRSRRRLAYASELIANTRLSISEIAQHLGFQHSSHFCTAYKKHFAVSPGQDMKRLRL